MKAAIVEAFKSDEKSILIATESGAEGINLQFCSLLINYDLPWNPNRIEQRFGRVHRIGQPNTCFMWSLVADDTREGDVYTRLLEKLEDRQLLAVVGSPFPLQVLSHGRLGCIWQVVAVFELHKTGQIAQE